MHYCRFRTDIDCCKKFMSNISNMSISPNVGDRVVVYNDSSFELGMKVTFREWVPSTSINGGLDLVCWLVQDTIFPTIPDLEHCLRRHGIRW